ncbi:MAG: hypothetical protein HYZ47_01350 [Simkania negevensis]|nr:hypothetical protein [Simkania negevensis]
MMKVKESFSLFYVDSSLHCGHEPFEAFVILLSVGKQSALLEVVVKRA